MGHDAGDMEQRPVDVPGGRQVPGERPFGAVALRLRHLRLDGGVVAPVGILMQLQGELLPDEARQGAHFQLRQVADGRDPIGQQALLGLFPHP